MIEVNTVFIGVLNNIKCFIFLGVQNVTNAYRHGILRKMASYSVKRTTGRHLESPVIHVDK